jgi:hypothetical protein
MSDIIANNIEITTTNQSDSSNVSITTVLSLNDYSYNFKLRRVLLIESNFNLGVDIRFTTTFKNNGGNFSTYQKFQNLTNQLISSVTSGNYTSLLQSEAEALNTDDIFEFSYSNSITILAYTFTIISSHSAFPTSIPTTSPKHKTHHRDVLGPGALAGSYILIYVQFIWFICFGIHNYDVNTE